MSTQKALLLLEPKGSYAVRNVDIPKPGPGELLTYPAVLGTDSAGIVKEVGEGIATFAVGDKELLREPKETFQQITVVPAEIAAKLLSNLTFDQAATVSLTLATAAFGLYSKKAAFHARGGAELVPPWQEGGRGKYDGPPILVIGRSSAVGQQGEEY
ncbi:chaperonin 10-like protein [Cytidiella melzeri]|nr:chaperonin 10-like protein [Cytidiella melzeri]